MNFCIVENPNDSSTDILNTTTQGPSKTRLNATTAPFLPAALTVCICLLAVMSIGMAVTLKLFLKMTVQGSKSMPCTINSTNS